MIVSNTHDDFENPPSVPPIVGHVKRQPHQESLSDAFSNAASGFAKVLSPPTTPSQSMCSPSKVVDIIMKNLEQLCCLQQLREDGILTEEVSYPKNICFEYTKPAGLKNFHDF